MKSAALGVRMHSGWGVLLAVVGEGHVIEVVDRRRIVVTDENMVGAKQPYHYAENLGLTEAKQHLADCAAVSERLALTVVEARSIGPPWTGDHKTAALAAAVVLAGGKAKL